MVRTNQLLPDEARPMEAKLVGELPQTGQWQFEPKWDGFRALVARDGDTVEIRSKSGKSLARFFPEIVTMVLELPKRRFVVDGELLLPIGPTLSFDALQQRLHPAASRIARLSRETPAEFMMFDCLAVDNDDLTGASLNERRHSLEAFFAKCCRPGLRLSPKTEDPAVALQWLASSGGALDGIVAKRLKEPYKFGERAMLKLKLQRTADCVLGGFRRSKEGKVVSLLLGLFNEERHLDHVGFCSAFGEADMAALSLKLAKNAGGAGFTGKTPGGPSRWNGGHEKPWEPLQPQLVVEVSYDQVTGQRFRHGTRFLRWRPDKAPAQCTVDQLEHEMRPAEMKGLFEASSSI